MNDGSKDNSSAIAHEYQKKYPDTFRVIDKENGNNESFYPSNDKYFIMFNLDNLLVA